MELLQQILSRRSCRKYTGEPIPQELLEQILLAGACAPSAHDSRPWRFAVVISPDGKQRLMQALQSRFALDLRAAGFPPEEVDARLSRSVSIFSSAPVLVVAFMARSQRKNPLETSGTAERVMCIQSVALAAGQMLLAAHALGIGGCWFAAPLFCAEEVAAACGMDFTKWEPQCLLTFGWPDQPPKPKAAPTVAEAAFWL